MAIKIEIEDITLFPVTGFIRNSKGVNEKFDFQLKAKRLQLDEVEEKLREDSAETISSFLQEVVIDWTGVMDASSAKVPFSTDSLMQLFKIPGVAMLAFQAYLREIGAKEKN